MKTSNAGRIFLGGEGDAFTNNVIDSTKAILLTTAL